MKVLLLGARGYLGSYIAKYAPKNIEMVISARDSSKITMDKEFIKIDIQDRNELLQAVSKVKPDVIINCIAISLPDFVEENKELAYEVNVEGVVNIIESCRLTNSRLIHISTDYVFSGENGKYTEDDIVNPINYYGYTKAEAERLIIGSGIKYLICRTAVLYGLKEDHHRDNLFCSFYSKFNSKKDVRAFTHQIGSPTLVDDLAICINKLLEFKNSGILHTCGYESLSRYEFALSMAEVLCFEKDFIVPIDEFALGRPARRPKNTSLNTEKLEREYGMKFRGIKEGLTYIREKFKHNA